MSLAVAVPPQIVIRDARPDDQAYVAATMSGELKRHLHRGADRVVDRVIDSPNVRVLIATDPDRTPGRDIIGWLAYKPIPRVRALLFVYVRNECRGQGVAHQLADAAWTSRKGQWVHGGLRGGATTSLLERFTAIVMNLDDLL